MPEMTTPTALTFAVHRREPVLVGPAKPTPRETKRLSDIDDQEVLRAHVPFIFFYRGRQVHEAEDCDPVAVIRQALGEALVPYYPLAGRLREIEGRKLVVDCTGEGVLFVEADADVRLADLEAADVLRAPFPCLDQLLFDVQGSRGVLNCPLLLIQVTRLLCGGFVLALRLNHTICDAIGLAQFMLAVAEVARGLPAPSVTPVWSRELLEARTPPKPSFPHREFDAAPIMIPPPPVETMVMRTFTFSPTDIAAIKKNYCLPAANLQNTAATSFETLTAALWRARTAALEFPPDEEVRLTIIVNFRTTLPELSLPAGYYGNACVPVAVVTTARALLSGSLADAVALVREAKAAVTAEFVRSTLDHLVLHGRPCVALGNLFLVSDNRHAGFHQVDFGRGRPVYGGPADAFFGVSFLVAVRDGDGEDAVAVPVVLPGPAMDRFASEVEMLLLLKG
ncbi:hypothetical protein PR202_gb24936 [Eleusine coracana subsp. coracana]|uniref:Benzyl alcohol O-benzoyltransferase n=1 Tax=Eleusine coracana subsp. coracana TaxID=191504 RepID=A0AAV5FNQ2_ELECO|nr:hypothetical protein QOZ80_5BG0453640 [Eleusine coracana subsp. coracana]GJN36100.1 hypothetical protein PR202_gb24936 [Eleusine coracana subsp. coracana]